MNKKKAVKILQGQIDKLSLIDKISLQFKNKLKSDIDFLFGEDSWESAHASNSIENKNECIEFLNNCIETVILRGLPRPKTVWKFIDKQNPTLVWSIFTATVAAIFAVGVFYGNVRCSSSKLTKESNNLTDTHSNKKKDGSNKYIIHNDSILNN